MFVWWYLKPLSRIFQLYRGGQFYWLEETGGPGENNRPVASHWQTLSHNVVHLALIEIRTHNIIGDRHWFRLHTVHSKCINNQTLRSDIFLPKCPTNVRQIWESTLSKSDYLVGHFGRTFWSDVRVDIKRFFFYISRGEYVKHFVINAYL